MSDFDLLKNAIKVVEEKTSKIDYLKKEINQEVLDVKDILMDTSIIDISLNNRQLYFMITVFNDSLKDDGVCNVLTLSLVLTIGSNQRNSIYPQIRAELNTLIYKEALNLLDEKAANKRYAVNKREVSSLKDETISDFVMRVGLDVCNNLETNIIKSKQELTKLQKYKDLLDEFKDIFTDNLFIFEKIISVIDRELTSFELRTQILYKEKVEEVIDSLLEKRTKGEMLQLSKELNEKPASGVGGMNKLKI